MEKLFSYGTLQLEKVQLQTFGRKLIGKKDILRGFVKQVIKIKDQKVIAQSGTEEHPILSYTGNEADQVEGMIFEISRENSNKPMSMKLKPIKEPNKSFSPAPPPGFIPKLFNFRPTIFEI